jgi:putative transposase
MKRKGGTGKIMTRSSRVFFEDLNVGKVAELKPFIVHMSDVQRFFVDQTWQRQDFSGKMPDLPWIHKGRDRFSIPVRLAQPMAKQAVEVVCSQHKKDVKAKPRLRSNVITLYSHHIEMQDFQGKYFDKCIMLKGAGSPTLILPFHSHPHLNRLIDKGWDIQNTVRLGLKKGKIYADLIFKKAKPEHRTDGEVIGMDSNYKAGFVLSDGQVLGTELYEEIQTYGKRKKRTHSRTKQLTNIAVKELDLRDLKVFVHEDLKHVKSKKRGTFSRQLNRRLSHWQYAHFVTRLSQDLEEAGVCVWKVNPAYTSQFCRMCYKWDRRNRNEDVFLCKTCGHSDHADLNAAKNMELLGLVGAYGLHSLEGAGPSAWSLLNPRKVRNRKPRPKRRRVSFAT